MSDRILGGACLALAAGMAWAAHGYAAPIAYEPVGPRAFPLLLAGLLAAGGAWLLARPSGHASGLRGAPLAGLGGVLGAVFAYAALFQVLGFALATAVMTVPVGLAFGGSWRQSAAMGVALGLLLFLLFDKVLDVVLPTGVLAFVLGGR